MSVLAKVLIAINAVFALFFLGVSATVYSWADDYKKANDVLQQEVEEWKVATAEHIDGLDSQITDLERLSNAKEAEKNHWKDQFDEAKAAQDSLNEDKNRLEKRFDELQLTHRQVIEVNTSQEDEIKALRNKLDQKDDELQIALRDKKTAEDQVARLTHIKTSLEQDLSEVRKKYNVASQKVKDQQLVLQTLEENGVRVQEIVAGHPPVKAIQGVVVAVRNDLDPALVLLSVGKDDGVEIGYQFTIYRGGEFIGRVVVEKVMADVAGARVMFAAENQSVTEGDSASTRLQ